MQKYKVICPNCNKLRIPYLKNSDLCQTCYRELLDKYAFYKYKNELKKPKTGTKCYNICEKVVNENAKSKELIELFNTSVTFIDYVKNKYLVRCDSEGNERPEFLRK